MRISDWSSDVCSSDLIYLQGDSCNLQFPNGLIGGSIHQGKKRHGKCLSELITVNISLPGDNRRVSPVQGHRQGKRFLIVADGKIPGHRKYLEPAFFSAQFNPETAIQLGRALGYLDRKSTRL